MRVALRAGLAMSCLVAVSACGGGGGGVGSTPPPPASPPPPPPSNANTSLEGTLLSESFTNDGAAGTVNYPKSGAGGTTSAAAANLSFIYDATTRTYSVTEGSNNQSFAPGTKDAALSNSQITVYKRTSGTTTDTLTLTNPGTSGALTYKYVGGSYWQRTNDTSAAVSGSLAAFTYGVETPDASLPRTGNAVYPLDLLGTSAYVDAIVSLRGTGQMLVKFGSNSLTYTGTYIEVQPNGTSNNFPYGFTGSATISSSANQFSGPISVANGMTGTANGRFYGPAADEVGVSFFATNPNAGISTVGTLLGRYQTGGISGISKKYLLSSVNGIYLNYSVDSNNNFLAFGPNGFYIVNSIEFDAASGNFTLVELGGRTAVFSSANRNAAASTSVFDVYEKASGSTKETLTLLKLGASNTALALTYSSFGIWRSTDAAAVAGQTQVYYRPFAYGQPTPTGLMPTSGTATYNGILIGGGTSGTVGGPTYDLSGTTRISIDFAASTLLGDISPTLTRVSDGTATVLSKSHFFANLLSSPQFFSNIGPNTYGNDPLAISGAISGILFGPDASEIVGSFRGQVGIPGDPLIFVAGAYGAKQ